MRRLLLHHLLARRGLLGEPLVLDDVLGRLRDHVTRARRSPCARRARRSGGSRAPRGWPVFSPSNLQSCVKSTVRIGMFTPMPSVSVPETTLSSPPWASFSTSSRYLGRSPAWCSPMPWRRKRWSSLPYGESKRTPSSAPAIALLLLLRGEVRAHEVLRLLGRGALREVDEVDGRAARRDQLLERLVQRRLAVLELERHGPRGVRGPRPPRVRSRCRSDSSIARVSPESGRHEEEARPSRARGAAPARPRRAPGRRSSGTRP